MLKQITSLLILQMITSASSFGLGGNKRSSSTKPILPSYDQTNDRYTPPTDTDFTLKYQPIGSLVRAGPLPFLTRITNPDKYEQAVLRYMYDTKVTNIQSAQGNMDFFFAAPDVWAAQKLREQKGEIEEYDYGQDVGVEQLVLRVAWSGVVVSLGGRVVWQLLHGQRNLW